MSGMNDIAYDISHLLEPDMVQVESLLKPVARAPAAAPTPVIDSVAAAQEAMARELMKAAVVHEEMIRQYVAIAGDNASDDSFA